MITDTLSLGTEALMLDRTSDDIAVLRQPVTVWTGGSCKPNPGIGGCAAILRGKDGTEILVSAGEQAATSNRMELKAAILAFETLQQPSRVTVRVDSEFVFFGMTERAARWEARRWRTTKGKPVENLDLWQHLIAVAAPHQVSWHLLKGLGRSSMKERVATLASEGRERQALHRETVKRSPRPVERPLMGTEGTAAYA